MQGRYNTLDYSTDALPGPSDYDGAKQFKIKVAKFGKANRDFLSKLNAIIPGPGDYKNEQLTSLKRSAPKCMYVLQL